MPIYEYHCTDCGHDFEKLVRFSDPKTNSAECPGCQSQNTRKRLSTIAIFSSGNTTTSSSASCGSSSAFR
ncbi:MAG: zinc ribbon domain-containing protein [Brevefilum sp.]|nr:zinc ribbon domain-containing protein [Brevefilum sp.]